MGKKTKLRRQIVDGENVATVKQDTAEDNQPETSPYVTPAITLSIGPSAKRYTVLQEFLDQCPAWAKLNPSYHLPELDDDIGHTLVHYLYTGTYQTLEIRGVSEDVERITEYRRSVLVYCAARTYGLSGLDGLAKTKIRILDERISVFVFLDIAREVYSKLPEDEMWFPEYLNEKIKSAHLADRALFLKEGFLNRIGKVTEFDRALVKIIVEIYIDKISGMVSKEKRAAEEASYADPPYDALPAEPSYDDPPSPLVEPAYDDPPSLTAEPSCEDLPCAKPAWDKPVNEKATIDAEPALELAGDENGLCILRAKHLFHGEMWKDCRKCRAFIRQVSLQLANEENVNEDGYNIVDRILK